MKSELRKKIERLPGPILVLGASGFVGANLFRMLLEVRSDVYGTASRLPAWRLEGLPEENVGATDLLVTSNLVALLDKIKPLAVFDCVSYGAYSFEQDPDLIYRTNVNCKVRLLEELQQRSIRIYVHAGSSSEYGTLAAAPLEDTVGLPNSHYAASKVAIAEVLKYMGKVRGMPCANLRLYSVFGPYEDSSRLVPTLLAKGIEGKLPPFVNPKTSRDFVYVDDACEAFVDTALYLPEQLYGESFNIGSGRCLSIAEVATITKNFFAINSEPEFSMPGRDWDVAEWFADPGKAAKHLGWQTQISFEDGLQLFDLWIRSLDNIDEYLRVSKKFGLNTRYSVSAIVACYLDGQAISIMHERLTQVFTKIGIDYEIIFVNDCSPDDSEEIVRKISKRDRRVIGISHSRNFGSQSAFRSGMEVSTKNACVLLDGDLQDPPELIEEFVCQWREGNDVIYGRRVKREASWYMQVAYKLFYRLFDKFSYLKIPHDAGDFSLMDKKVVRCLLQFPERDLFLRGIRAFAGFKQVGVDYVRPERMFGVTTNSLFKNLGWAKKGILSFSHAPLNFLTALSISLVSITLCIALLQVVAKLLFPFSAPTGVTTMMLSIMFFGSANLLAVSLVGEYIAKIFEEVKRRPHFLRRSIIRDGEIRDAADEIIQIVKQQGEKNGSG
jgi:dolichol-phosphate mannosyltransferase